MLIKTLPVGQLETNCYVVTDEDVYKRQGWSGAAAARAARWPTSPAGARAGCTRRNC